MLVMWRLISVLVTTKNVSVSADGWVGDTLGLLAVIIVSSQPPILRSFRPVLGQKCIIRTTQLATIFCHMHKLSHEETPVAEVFPSLETQNMNDEILSV